MAAPNHDDLDELLDSALDDFQTLNLSTKTSPAPTIGRSDEARDNKQEVPPLASGVQGLRLGLPDLKAKKKGKQKASKESHVSDALDKLRAETREAVKGLESVTTAARPLIPDLGNDAMMDDWVKQFEELAGSQLGKFRDMGRAPCCDKANVKKGPWSPDEDAKLKEYIDKYGTGGNWIALPQKVGLRRCGKSCRLRWLNYLRPNIKHGEFSEEEDNIIMNLFANIGSRWSIIAAQLPGRTDNDIKNYWNTKLKKKLMNLINPTTQGLLLRNPAHQPSTISSLLQHSSSQPSSSSSPSSLICAQAGSFNTTATGFEQPISSFTSTTILNQESLSYLGQMPPHYQVNRERFQQLMFSTGGGGGGGEASCSSSDGSCNNNDQAFLQTNNFYQSNNNGVKQENQEAVMVSNGNYNNTITHVDGNGSWGSSEQAPLEYFGLEEIKQLISSSRSSSSNTNNIATGNNNTSSCSNFVFDENKTTEERVLYYY